MPRWLLFGVYIEITAGYTTLSDTLLRELHCAADSPFSSLPRFLAWWWAGDVSSRPPILCEALKLATVNTSQSIRITSRRLIWAAWWLRGSRSEPCGWVCVLFAYVLLFSRHQTLSCYLNSRAWEYRTGCWVLVFHASRWELSETSGRTPENERNSEIRKHCSYLMSQEKSGRAVWKEKIRRECVKEGSGWRRERRRR